MHWVVHRVSRHLTLGIWSATSLSVASRSAPHSPLTAGRCTLDRHRTTKGDTATANYHWIGGVGAGVPNAHAKCGKCLAFGICRSRSTITDWADYVCIDSVSEPTSVRALVYISQSYGKKSSVFFKTQCIILRYTSSPKDCRSWGQVHKRSYDNI